MVPYYQRSLTGIREYYRNGNDASELDAAVSKINSIGNLAKRENNLRVIAAFRRSAASERRLESVHCPKISASISTVSIRFSADLHATEDNVPIAFFYNSRSERLEPEEALLTIEIAHWVATQNHLPLRVSDITYFDLFTDTSYRIQSANHLTMATLASSIGQIERAWEEL